MESDHVMGPNDAATRRTTLKIPMAFSLNHPYFNGLYFNGLYISTAAYFNVLLFQFLMRVCHKITILLSLDGLNYPPNMRPIHVWRSQTPVGVR
jgi:hypothetical protein